MKRPDATPSSHPDDQTLTLAMIEPEDGDLVRDVSEHLEDCSSCRRRFDQIVRQDPTSDQICKALRSESLSVRSAAAASFDNAKESISDFAVSFLQPSDHPHAMGRLADFDVMSVIGAGGMGIVLKGHQAELNRPVAIKVMAPHLAMVGVARQRFLREARAAAAIVHPNVMPVLSVGESNTTPFLVMPYLACHSLQQRIDTTGTLPLKDLLRIAVQVARGLAAAHEQGLIHRDIKPANILLERGVDRALLTDFGLARAIDDVQVTRSGVIAGTPQYMSPQQAKGEPIDARSDLFSLGGTIAAMATGSPAFDGATTYAVMHSIAQDDPPSLRSVNADIPQWLDHYVWTLLAKNPEKRPASAAAVADTLQAALAHVQQPTVCDLPKEVLGTDDGQRLGRFWASLLVAAVLVLMLAAGSMWWPAENGESVPDKQVTQTTPPNEKSIDQRLDHLESELAAIEDELSDLMQPVTTE